MSSTAGARTGPHVGWADLPDIVPALVVGLRRTTGALLVALAAVFLLRRVAGGFAQPLGGAALVGVACLLIVVVAWLRSGSLRVRFGESMRVAEFAQLAWPAVAAAVLLGSLTLQGTAAWGIVAAWFLLAVAECTTWLLRMPPPIVGRHWNRPARSVAIRSLPEPTAEAAEESISDSLVQQLTRERMAGGGESLHAIVRAICQPGERQAVVHLAFCPPLADQPRLVAHTIDASEAQVRITLAATYGARIEVQLPRPAAAGESVVVEVIGDVPPDAAYVDPPVPPSALSR